MIWDDPQQCQVLRFRDVLGFAPAVQPKLEPQDTSGKFALGEDKLK